MSQPHSEQFDLLFGALDLMASDIRDAMELNDKMTELSQSKKQLSMAQKIARLGSWDWYVQTGKLTWSDETFGSTATHLEVWMSPMSFLSVIYILKSVNLSWRRFNDPDRKRPLRKHPESHRRPWS